MQVIILYSAEASANTHGSEHQTIKNLFPADVMRKGTSIHTPLRRPMNAPSVYRFVFLNLCRCSLS